MAIEQIGTAYKIGIGSAVYSATVDPRTFDYSSDADEEMIPDDDGDAQTIILRNPRTMLSLNAMILNAGSFTPPTKGAIVEVTPPGGSATKYRITGTPRVTGERGQVARLAVDLVRETSMGSVYDA